MSKLKNIISKKQDLPKKPRQTVSSEDIKFDEIVGTVLRNGRFLKPCKN